MESIWHQTAKFAPCPPLSGDLKAEAAVIGGGLAGILTAAFLTEAGVSTVVLEANRTGFGQPSTGPYTGSWNPPTAQRRPACTPRPSRRRWRTTSG